MIELFVVEILYPDALEGIPQGVTTRGLIAIPESCFICLSLEEAWNL